MSRFYEAVQVLRQMKFQIQNFESTQPYNPLAPKQAGTLIVRTPLGEDMVLAKT